MSGNFKIFSIEGNIGSGKSTLFEKLQKMYVDTDNVIFLEEPVGLWEKIKNEEGETMLQLFYKNKDQKPGTGTGTKNRKNYAFQFQIMALSSRLAILKKAVETNKDKDKDKNIIIITERCLHTDRHVFAKMLADKLEMESVEYQIYLNLFNTFIDDYPVNNIIYIKTAPTICHQRIHKRSRVGEEVIPLKYLEDCHLYHENFLDPVVGINSVKLLFNGNVDIFDNPNVLGDWIHQIDIFINS
jgi:deoxyadenosine/deoxycytidine kinase